VLDIVEGRASVWAAHRRGFEPRTTPALADRQFRAGDGAAL